MNVSDRYEPHTEQAAGEIIEGEAVIINLATGVYYSLNGVAGEIWRLVTERIDVASMVRGIVASYEIDEVTAGRDVTRVLEQLVAEGLIRPASLDASRGAAAPQTASRAPYVAPDVQIYRDMQDLLALDPPSPGLNGVVWKRSIEPA